MSTYFFGTRVSWYTQTGKCCGYIEYIGRDMSSTEFVFGVVLLLLGNGRFVGSNKYVN